MKLCTKCNQIKALSEFHRKRATKDGYAYHCKECVSAYDKNEHLGIMVFVPLVKTDTHKQCRTCGGMFENKEFHRIKKNKVIIDSYCLACRDKYSFKRNVEKMGLSIEAYESMMAAQNNLCYICKRPEKTGRRLSIDHDHNCCPSGRSCGKCVRGLICLKCNTALGAVNDDPQILLSMISYLQSYNYRLI